METDNLSDDKKPIEIMHNGSLLKTIHKPSDKTDNFIKQTGTFSQEKPMVPHHNSKTITTSTYNNKRDELVNILFEVMNKMFSARVVLKRLTNLAVKKVMPKETITRNKIKEAAETFCRHEKIAYKRICPKCGKPPVKRRTHYCHSCKIDLIYKCQKCHKQFNNYKCLLVHLDSICFIRGYYHCPECDFKSIIPSSVKRHMIRMHPSLEYNKKTTKWTDVREVSQSLLHKCSQCGKTFKSHVFLNMHIPWCKKSHKIIESNPDGQYQINKDFQKMIVRFCPKCEKDVKVYESGVSNSQACQKCGSMMKFKCSKCSKQYQLYSSIIYHTRLRCGASNPKKRRLKYSGKTSMDCPHCDQQFVKHAWLRRHLLRCKALTRKKRPIPRNHKYLRVTCKQCNGVQRITERRKICGTCKSSLNFQCKTCGINFTAGCDSWCEHLKTYFSRVKYVCDDCGAGSISRKLMIRHVSICNSKNFHCDLCNYTTKFKSNLNKHMLFRHLLVNS